MKWMLPAILGVLVGCGSLPKADALPLPQSIVIGSADRIVYLPECEVECPESVAPYCHARIHALHMLLIETGVFREVSIGGAGDAEPGDYVVDIHDFPTRPYWSTPGHNPGFFLLSLVIPFWWSQPSGVNFSVREVPDGEWRHIDTRWEGTVVMWSLAPLINILPGRTFKRTFDQDTERLRSQLVGVSG